MTKQQQLTEATTKANEARDRMNASSIGQKAWREAAEDVEFWSNKVAFLDAWIKNEAA